MKAVALGAWLACAAAFPLTAFAQAAPAAQAAGPVVTLESAVPDVASGTITIAGTNFGSRPFVTMDLVPLNVRLALDARILAAAPLSMMPPGTYLITVARGPGAGESASIEMRLGEPASTPAAAGASLGSAPASAPATTITGHAPAPTDPAAKVGDTVITVAEVDREWQRTDPAGYLSAMRQLHEGRRLAASALLTRELLSREAVSRGLTVDALLAEELKKRAVPLPDTAVTALYQSMGDRTRGASLDQLRPALRAWLERKAEPELARMSYLEELTKVSTRADTVLEAPRVTVAHADDDPALGPAMAPVELVLFGDFMSSEYARFALTVPRVREAFGSRLRVVFKHMPSPDPASVATSEAAVCASAQGKFWEFHDTLLGRAGALDRARFRAVASDVRLDAAAFEACLDAPATAARVRGAVDEARRYDIGGSPSILVNGRLAPPPPEFLPPFEYFKRLIEEELQQASVANR
jgi:protein-disulfide isomerase